MENLTPVNDCPLRDRRAGRGRSAASSSSSSPPSPRISGDARYRRRPRPMAAEEDEEEVASHSFGSLGTNDLRYFCGSFARFLYALARAARVPAQASATASSISTGLLLWQCGFPSGTFSL